MTHYVHYFKRYMPLALTALVCVFCEAVCDLLQPTMMSKIIDDGVRSGDVQLVLYYGGTMLIISLAGMCFAITRNVLASRVSQSFGADLRFDAFEKVLRLSQKSTDKLGAGSLLTRLTNDTSQVTQFAHGMMRIFFKAPLTCFGAIVLAVMLSPRLSLVLFVMIAIVGAMIGISMKLSYRRFRKVQGAIDRMNTVVGEYLSGVRLVKTFGKFDEEEAQFEKVSSDLSEKTVKSQLVIAIFSPLMTLTVNLSILIIFAFGSVLFVHGEIEVGKIAAFISYMTQILGSLIMITNIFNVFVRTKASASRIAEIMDCDEEAWDMENTPENTPEPAAIRFEEVTFSYPDGSGLPAIKNLSFAIEENKTLAIIGATGSGKSTIAWLLLRFYPLNAGKILVGTQEITTLPIGAYRNLIAIAPQKSMLFSGTVRDNLLWGNSTATPQELVHAAKIACADDFIKTMEEGYDSLLGQGGVNLSGGQKQRISIARALLKSAPILILDDCMSALDAVTEASVRKGLREQPSTKLIITQKITTAMSADKILVLEHGERVGFGTHETLLKTCEIYQGIYESQIGKN